MIAAAGARLRFLRHAGMAAVAVIARGAVSVHRARRLAGNRSASVRAARLRRQGRARAGSRAARGDRLHAVAAGGGAALRRHARVRAGDGARSVAGAAARRPVRGTSRAGTVRRSGSQGRAGADAARDVARLALAAASRVAAGPVYAVAGGAFAVANAGRTLRLDEGGRDRARSGDVRHQVAAGDHLRGHVDEVVRERRHLVPRRRGEGARRRLAVVDRRRAAERAVRARAGRDRELIDGETRGERVVAADVRERMARDRPDRAAVHEHVGDVVVRVGGDRDGESPRGRDRLRSGRGHRAVRSRGGSDRVPGDAGAGGNAVGVCRILVAALSVRRARRAGVARLATDGGRAAALAVGGAREAAARRVAPWLRGVLGAALGVGRARDARTGRRVADGSDARALGVRGALVREIEARRRRGVGR